MHGMSRMSAGGSTAQPPVNLAVHVTAMQNLDGKRGAHHAVWCSWGYCRTAFDCSNNVRDGLFGASPKATATGSSPAIANNPYPDLPANYRKQIADYMQTQRVALGLLPLVIHQGETVEISDPNRKFIGGGVWVCVRFGGTTVRAYGFADGQLQKWTGNSFDQSGVLIQARICGFNPNYKPFPEVKPTPQPRKP
jgi:hypothetical protein